MEEHTSQHETAPQTLDYRPASADRAISKVQFWWGSFVGVSATMLGVFVGVVGSLDIGRPPRPGSIRLFWIWIGVTVVFINSLAACLYLTRKWQSLALGLWTGFGVGALIEGACFATIG